MKARLKAGNVSVGWPRPFKVGPPVNPHVPPWEPGMSNAESLREARKQLAWWKGLTTSEKTSGGPETVVELPDSMGPVLAEKVDGKLPLTRHLRARVWKWIRATNAVERLGLDIRGSIDKVVKAKKPTKTGKPGRKPSFTWKVKNKEMRPDPQDIPIDAYGDPDLRYFAENGKIIVTFSGGKDSLAMLLYIIEACIKLKLDPSKCIEVWHHCVDGRPEKYWKGKDLGKSEWDWPITEAYCEAVCECLGIDLRFNWRVGGLMGTVLRGEKGDESRAPAEFALRPNEMPDPRDVIKIAESRGFKVEIGVERGDPSITLKIGSPDNRLITKTRIPRRGMNAAESRQAGWKAAANELLPHVTEHDGTIIGISGGKGDKNTRMSFPKQGDIAGGRWCSSEVKIDVADAHLSARKDLWNGAILICTGERAEESTNRQGYSEREFYGMWKHDRVVKEIDVTEANRLGFKSVDAAMKAGVIRKVKGGYEAPAWSGMHGSHDRYVEKWRPIHKWCEFDIWAIIARWGIVAHPAYFLGWGRLSCQTCIFGSKHQWATIRRIDRGKWDAFVDMEAYLTRVKKKKGGKALKRITTIKSTALNEFEAKKVGKKAGDTVPRALPLFTGNAQPFSAAVDPKNKHWVKLSKSRRWQGPIRVPLKSWRLPEGAFGEDTGPT
jgi:3'-phosphoadenosine 5'-phosphosulfate sulfotransferase (PAPS reductase)/FAD synthetase